MSRVVLASKSPRRRELLSIIEPDYILAPDREVEETYPDSLAAEDVPAYLSQLKSRGFADAVEPGDILLTADTVVILDGEILGKPHDETDACGMLRRLSGRTHHVVTGVTLFTPGKEPMTFSATTEVKFAELAEEDIRHYVSEYRPLDKAGAYGIQEWIGAAAIEKINGSYYNVVGLPLNKLFKALRAIRSQK